MHKLIFPNGYIMVVVRVRGIAGFNAFTANYCVGFNDVRGNQLGNKLDLVDRKTVIDLARTARMLGRRG